MKKSKRFFLIGILMLVIMLAFLAYALTHPEASFSFSLDITYLIYIIYLTATVSMFVISFILKKLGK